MQFSATQIALLIGGKVEGNADAAVGSFGKIEEAQAGQLSFLANPKYEEFLYSTKASVIIVNESQELKQPVNAALIRVPDAYSAFATLLDKYQQIKQQQLTGIQQPVYIDATAKTGDNIFIGAFSYLGENVILANGAKIYPGVYLGVDAGSALGHLVLEDVEPDRAGLFAELDDERQADVAEPDDSDDRQDGSLRCVVRSVARKDRPR